MDIIKKSDLIQINQPKEGYGNKKNETYIDKEKKNMYKEETPKAVQMNYDRSTERIVNAIPNENNRNNIILGGGAPIIKGEMKTIFLSLNAYWIDLISSIALILMLIIVIYVVLVGCALIKNLLEKFDMEIFENIFHEITYTIGLKWFLFIILNLNLSIGFFCMTTFSKVLKDTMNIKKFYIINSIGFAIYYSLSVVILKVFIKDMIGNYFRDEVDNTRVSKKAEVRKVFDDLVEYILRFVGDFLGSFNTFLENITIGTMYIFLFYVPENYSGKKLLYFRLLSLIPIVYIVVSLILRALYNTKVIWINIYVLPFLLGAKITVYLFFVSTLLLIKYKSLAYNVFDPERFIDPKVFSKIGSICFGLLGVLELLIGLFFPSWSAVIGSKYLLVLCAPIMALYDYKRIYVLNLPCCKQRNFTSCLKIIILVVGWLIVIVFGLEVLSVVLDILREYFVPLIKWVDEHMELVIIIIAHSV